MFKQHPKGLFVLFFTEMWERFSYYGMRAILALYMIKALLYQEAFTSSIYGYYTGLVYLTPLLGGYVADRYWGNRRSIIFGGILMAIGQFALFFSGSFYDPLLASQGTEYTYFVFNIQQILFLLGLFFLVVGNGFFKPNISTMVGSLYPQGDKRRDSAFTIFYMGINLGALLSPLVAGGLGDTGDPADFKWGFLAAGIGMLLGLIVFYWGKNKYLVTPSGEQVGLIPPKKIKDEVNAAPKTPLTREEKQRISVIFILAFFVIFFWAAFEQAGVSLTFFADQKTDRYLGFLDWTIPASYFQSINPIAIVIFAPVFAMIWTRLGNKGKEPSSPTKMAFGLLILSLGFLLLIPAANRVDGGASVSPMWLVGAYTLHTFGELCLSPIGLSMVTKLAPLKFASLLMGVWFLANAAANWLAGMLSTLYPAPGRTEFASIFGYTVTDFSSFFMIFVVMAAVASLILFLIAGLLKKMMHGVE